MTGPAEVLAAAHEFAVRGWQVLPLHTPGPVCSCTRGPGCDSPGKHPRVRWPVGQRVDDQQITRWWRRWPDANLGIVTGAVSGVLVLDVDPRHGGSESLAELDRRHRLPVTATVVTGSGGTHLYLEALPSRWREKSSFHMSLPFINRTRRFAEGLGNNSSFLVDLAADSPPRLLGKPLYENSEMVSTLSVATASNDDVCVVADFRQYLIADRVGTVVEYVPHLFGPSGRPTGSRGWYAYFRTGGDWLTTDAGRVLRV